jgi:hypothetical protein
VIKYKKVVGSEKMPTSIARFEREKIVEEVWRKKSIAVDDFAIMGQRMTAAYALALHARP